MPELSGLGDHARRPLRAASRGDRDQRRLPGLADPLRQDAGIEGTRPQRTPCKAEHREHDRDSSQACQAVQAEHRAECRERDRRRDGQ